MRVSLSEVCAPWAPIASEKGGDIGRGRVRESVSEASAPCAPIAPKVPTMPVCVCVCVCVCDRERERESE